MNSDIEIKEIVPIDLEGGTLVNGFPSSGITSAIATESLINTGNFELGATIDSDKFPPISIIKDGMPNYASRIVINKDLKVGIFSSYLTLDVTMHRSAARMMLNWAKEKKCSTIVSSITVQGSNELEVFGVASTGKARGKLVENEITMINHATIPGISGVLLNEGSMRGQDVIVLLVSSNKEIPDFKATSNLCETFSKIIPGMSCDLTKLENESKIIEEQLQKATADTKDLGDHIYR
tara:strand:- start:986 stop:1696 length:711 start_codon:yes stop_codon:yes gene_type:complete